MNVWNDSRPMLEAIEHLVDGDELHLLVNCTWGHQRRSNIYLPSVSNSAENVEEEVNEEAATVTTEEDINVTIVCFACAVIVSTVAFNFILLTIALRRRLWKEVSCQLAMSQSIVDLCLALVIMPIHFMVDLHLSELVMSLSYFCEFWSTADVFLCTLSILHQLGMCFDKYLTMRGANFEHFSHRFIVYTVVFTIISGSVAAPLLFDCQTAVTATFVVASTTVSFYIPTIIMLLLIARITFHTFRVNQCKQCKAMGQDLSHRHVVFNAITLHWRKPVVKHSVSMPFVRHGGHGHNHTSTYTSVKHPLVMTHNTNNIIRSPRPMRKDPFVKSDFSADKADVMSCSSSTEMSVIEEIEVAKTAALLALPTRLPCTRSELMRNRSKRSSIVALKPRLDCIPIMPAIKGYCNPCFSPGVSSVTTLQPRRYDTSTASTSSVNTSSNQSAISHHYKIHNNHDTASETKALLASRKTVLDTNHNHHSFMKALQHKVCHQSNHQACYERSRIKALRTTASTFICVSCWAPFFSLFVLYFVFEITVPNILFRASLWLGYMNGILNPLLYILGKRKMRF